LDQPTRDGDGRVPLMTNLPATICAREIADVYRYRWEELMGDSPEDEDLARLLG
jgi:hypothetical protein